MSSKKGLIDKQAKFWVLMAQGSTLTAACEAIGVHRQPGRSLALSDRWSDPRGNGPQRQGDTYLWSNGFRSPTCTWGGPACGRLPSIGRSASTVSRGLRRKGLRAHAASAWKVRAVGGTEAGRTAGWPTKGRHVRSRRVGDRGAIEAVCEVEP
jgi:hypothetical protein